MKRSHGICLKSAAALCCFHCFYDPSCILNLFQICAELIPLKMKAQQIVLSQKKRTAGQVKILS